MSQIQKSELEAAAIAALRRLHKITDGQDAVFDIVAIMGMIEMFIAMFEQCQTRKGRRGRLRSAGEMLQAAQEPSRRVWVGAYRTARRDGNSKEESIDLVEAWIETAKNTTVEAVERMLDESESPLSL